MASAVHSFSWQWRSPREVPHYQRLLAKLLNFQRKKLESQEPFVCISSPAEVSSFVTVVENEIGVCREIKLVILFLNLHLKCPSTSLFRVYTNFCLIFLSNIPDQLSISLVLMERDLCLRWFRRFWRNARHRQHHSP